MGKRRRFEFLELGMDTSDIIIYKSQDGKASVALYAHDGNVWLNQKQLAEFFATSKANVSIHIANVLEEEELSENSVVKDFLTTAADGKRQGIGAGTVNVT